jgi:tetratricopeptide (TPR) repeat protein
MAYNLTMLLAALLLLGMLQDPAPSAEEIQAAREWLRETYRDQYAKTLPEQRQALARRMMGSFATEPPGPNRPALLLEAIDLAVAASDTPTAVAAIEELSKTPGAWTGPRFKVLELQEKKDRPGAQADGWANLAADAMESGDYDLAVKAADKADAAAGKRKDPSLIEQARDLREQARTLQREFKAIEDQVRKLRETPEDPAANEALGRFHCFARGDWEKGLPYLSRAADPLLRSLAEADRATKPEMTGMLASGDRWWDWAEKQSAKSVRDSARGRAARWYELSMGGLLESERGRVEKRLRILGDAGGGGPAGNVALARSGAVATGGTHPEVLIDGISTGYTGSSGFAYGAFPVEFIVTLPRALPLRMIRLLLWDGQARFYRFAVETSSDGRSFQPLVDRGQGEWRSWQTLSFAPRRVKAIKLKGLYNSANGDFHCVELEAYCKPPAIAPSPMPPK